MRQNHQAQGETLNTFRNCFYCIIIIQNRLQMQREQTIMEQIRRLEETIQDIYGENQTLNLEIEKKNQQSIEKLEAIIKQNQKKNNQHLERHQSLVNYYRHNYSQFNKKMQGSLDENIQAKKKILHQNIALKKDYKKLEKQKKIFQKKLENSEKKLKDGEKKLEDCKKKLEDYEKKMQTLIRNNNQLSKQISSLTQELQDFQRNNEQIIQLAQILEKQKEEMEKNYEDQRLRNNQLSDEKQRIQFQKKQVQQQLKIQKAGWSREYQIIKSITETKVKDLQIKFQAQAQSWKQTKKSLQSQIKSHQRLFNIMRNGFNGRQIDEFNEEPLSDEYSQTIAFLQKENEILKRIIEGQNNAHEYFYLQSRIIEKLQMRISNLKYINRLNYQKRAAFEGQIRNRN